MDVSSDETGGGVPDENGELELSVEPSQEQQGESGGATEGVEGNNPEDPSGAMEDRQVNEYHFAILGGVCAAGASNRKKRVPSKEGEEESGSDADDAPGKGIFHP